MCGRMARGLSVTLVIFLATVTGGGALAQPGAGRIVFVSSREGSEQIYVMDADGSNVARLTNAGTNWTPTFSQDGTKIAFASTRDGNLQIYVMNADGSNVTRLTNPSGRSGRPAFSPDGRRIAFNSDRDGSDQIYIMDADGTNVTRLTNPPGTSGQPAFSPDGRTIAFVSDRQNRIGPLRIGGEFQIYVMEAKGANATRLTNTPGASIYPAFSPDGQKIAFQSTVERRPQVNMIERVSQIYMMNADGSNMKQLTSTLGGNIAPAFSPDGHKIAFTSNRDGSSQVYVMDADGSNVTRLTNPPGQSYEPAFGP